MKKYTGLGLFLFSMSLAFAQSAYVTEEEKQGAEKFNQKLLVDQYYNQCLMTCSQSENPDCATNCEELAKDKAAVVESAE